MRGRHNKYFYNNDIFIQRHGSRVQVSKSPVVGHPAAAGEVQGLELGELQVHVLEVAVVVRGQVVHLAAGEAEVGEGGGEVAEDNLVCVEVEILQFQSSELQHRGVTVNPSQKGL